MADRYKIVRVVYREPARRGDHLDVSRRTIKTGLTLEEAQAHCQDPETSAKTCTTAAAKRITKRCGGDWVDQYTRM